LKPPDLVAFHVLHRGMRVDSARLAKAVAEVDEPERTARARQLHRWYDGFVGELHAHHVVEDELFFPALVERVSMFEHQIGRIDAEHSYLDAAMDRTRRALGRLGDPTMSWPDASRRAVNCTAELHELLENHLDFEDEHVLPLFVEHFGADEYGILDARAAKAVAFGQLPFTIPWAMANADPLEQESLLEGAPLVFKLLWWATRHRYRRLTEEAFGTNGNNVNGHGIDGDDNGNGVNGSSGH
jgi:hypothetical protein